MPMHVHFLELLQDPMYLSVETPGQALCRCNGNEHIQGFKSLLHCHSHLSPWTLCPHKVLTSEENPCLFSFLDYIYILIITQYHLWNLTQQVQLAFNPKAASSTHRVAFLSADHADRSWHLTSVAIGMVSLPRPLPPGPEALIFLHLSSNIKTHRIPQSCQITWKRTWFWGFRTNGYIREFAGWKFNGAFPVKFLAECWLLHFQKSAIRPISRWYKCWFKQMISFKVTWSPSNHGDHKPIKITI